MPEERFDIAIIGCGPAGLAAAINATIRKKKIVLFGTDFCSPKLNSAPTVDNYLGFHAITGEDLRSNFFKHLEKMGLEVTRARVDSVYPSDEGFSLIARNETYSAKKVIIATGTPSKSSLAGEEELIGKGVSYCATCDGPLFTGKTVALIASTNEAIEEANYLAEVCSKLYFIPTKDIDISHLSEKIEILKEKPLAIEASGIVSGLKLETRTLEVSGVFIIRESVPPAQLVPGLEIADNAIKTTKLMETNLPGIYAAGDCTGWPWQLSKAAGEGQVAALNAVRSLDQKI